MQPQNSDKLDAQQYNYDRFQAMTLGRDAKLVAMPVGPVPGDVAPDFTLQDTSGKSWTLKELRGKPVVLIFASGTCPMTTGSLPGLSKLHAERNGTEQWLMVYVREAHPGEDMPAHETMEQKRQQAERFKREGAVAWPIVVDELDGSTHQRYSVLPNHVFLIDRDGVVAFRGEFAHAPTLFRALGQLEKQGNRDVIPLGIDKKAHMLGPTAYGWRGPDRGGKVSKQDLIKRMPPLAANLLMGKAMQPLLEPLASRSRPLPPIVKAAMALGALGVLGLILRRMLK
jgi:hypothetical protein